MAVGPPRLRSRKAARLKWTAFLVCVALAIIGALLGLRSPMLHQYEYQEDVYVSLDGSASVYIGASLPALAALYGLDIPTDPGALLDRRKLREALGGPGVTVSSINSWRRYGRRFVTVRLDTNDIRRLPAAKPFAASTFEFGRSKNGYSLIEELGPARNKPIPSVGWDRKELVGFRWHIPSRVIKHNTFRQNVLRGNILVWEQSLADRLSGVPLEMQVDMQGQSILYGALWLFAASALSAVLVVALIVWWVVARGKKGQMDARAERAQGGRR